MTTAQAETATVSHLTVNMALMTTLILWSSAFVGIRYGLTEYSPGSLALLRFSIASIGMAVIYFTLPSRTKVRLSDVPILLLMGTCGIGLYNLALNYGEVAVSASLASFILSLMPIFTIVFAIIFLREKVNKRMWFGVAVSMVGIMLIAYSEIQDWEFDKGVLACLVAAISASSFMTIQKPLLKRFHPLELATFAIWSGNLMFLIFIPDLWQQIQAASTKTSLSVVYLGLFPACLAQSTWAYAMSKIPASKAVVTLYAMPLVTCLLEWLILDDVPTALAFFGGVVAVFGAFLVNYFSKLNKHQQ